MQPDLSRMFALTTHGTQSVYDTGFLPGDWFVFGAESRGLPPELRETFPPRSACGCRCCPTSAA